jgi:hypothetical protein
MMSIYATVGRFLLDYWLRPYEPPLAPIKECPIRLVGYLVVERSSTS